MEFIKHAFPLSVLSSLKKNIYYTYGHGEGKADKADGIPSATVPSEASAQRTKTTTGKEVAHKDGVAAVNGLGHQSKTTALVAQLVALCPHIHQHDGEDKPHITVGKQHAQHAYRLDDRTNDKYGTPSGPFSHNPLSTLPPSTPLSNPVSTKPILRDLFSITRASFPEFHHFLPASSPLPQLPKGDCDSCCSDLASWFYYSF